MAVAQTLASEFGKAETTLMVNKPLLLQPSYPRFARVGDSFEGGVVLHNYSSEEKTVVLLTSARGIRLIGADSSVHQLGPGQATEVRKKYTAEKAGKATFIFRARSKGETDGLQWTIPIHHPRSTESVALYESTTDSLTLERIAVPPSIYPDIGEVSVEIASTPLVKLSGGISYLFSYPYGCLEQRLSAILPVILAEDLVKAFKFEVYKDKDYRQVVLKTLDELSAFQRPSGGFSYWKSDQQESPYASAYAIYTLVEAQRKGYPVSQRTLQRGLEYIGRVLRGEESYGPYTKYAGYTTRALILYTLALLEKPDHGYMEKLYSNRRELPLFAEAYLLRALTHAKGKQSMSEELIRDLGNRAKISPTSAHFEERNDLGLAWVFDSNVRTTALILQALVETQPKNLLIPRVLRWLLDQQKNGAWRTTQENLYVVDALATYFRTFERQEADFKASVSIAGHEVLNQMFTGRTLATATTSMPLASLRQGTEERVVLRKAGSGELFYGVRMDYAPKGATKAKEEGLTVLKTIEPVEGTLEKDEPFKVGTMYRVTLNVVTNQSRNFVVVDDPLPAGFETVSTSLQTSAANLDQLLRGSNKAENWTFNPFTHQEAYDDHVLVTGDFLPAGVYSFSYLVRATSFGTFSVPTTRAEAMYEPEVFGQTGSSVVVVK